LKHEGIGNDALEEANNGVYVNSISNEQDNDYYAFPLSTKLYREVYQEDTTPKQFTVDTIVELRNRKGKVVLIKALRDTGATSTIILREFLQKGRANTPNKKHTKWTLRGSFTTRYEYLFDLKLPELSQDNVATWQVHVDDKTSKDDSSYDIIIGTELLCNICLALVTDNKSLR
jgi:hypothetical protein